MANQPMGSFSQPLDYTQIVFKKIQDCMTSKTTNEYFQNVEMLSDILIPYIDDAFKVEMGDHNISQDLSNPYFRKLTDDAKMDYARSLFRAIMRLVHRSGFMPYQSVEIIIDDEKAEEEEEEDEKSSSTSLF